MKKIVVLMLSAAIVCMPCAAFAQASQTSELERFLAEHNLTIPQVFADESGAEDFYYWVMDMLEERAMLCFRRPIDMHRDIEQRNCQGKVACISFCVDGLIIYVIFVLSMWYLFR